MTIVSSIGGPVPRFFFDMHSGDRSISDKAGLELKSPEAAKAIA
jgi:hypothetical protein